ncbi:conserved hypothetical protein [Caldicellulosiruptor hydrothermalis 108]|uniref:Uncharacterized protein n=1 Tax=Caldicellulosiruptor hydrothermalis (strain DSM 18901 / VKM B-2411 / 108) TaxID=632292 RepID=E4QBZ7_CALH1|nr:hypothetical protein [Caldicellulosiruptor hydrothermalis]ADQ06171.1 conserved hypothetical protein [Caldicellulosiruptor hydrothermalis 108]
MSLQKRRLQRYLQRLVLRNYKLLDKGKKTIAFADARGVFVSYYFDAVELKTGKSVKLKVETFYYLGEKHATPEEVWYSLGGK